MANRYWVGGTASWDGTAGAKWSTTSGGAGGASVPTISDDVFFDANSTGTVTIATGNTGAKSITCTGFTGTIAGSAAITVAGSVTLVSGMTYTHTGTVTFTGTGTLTTAGKVFSTIDINGSGITLTLGDALNTSTRQIIITQGSFDTANYAVTTASLVSSNTNVRSISLGSSTVTISGATTIFISNAANLTFNAGTSQINCSSNQANITAAGGQTFYNVSFTQTTVAGLRQIVESNTFNNLTFNSTLSSSDILAIFGANQTINGTLTFSASSATQRIFVRSNTLGAARTLTAAAVVADNCDFRDITIAGAAAPISPARAGDCGGNSGITFPAAKTVYRVGTDTTWAGSSSWALTSGGTGSNNNFPLPQDTAVIDNNTALTGTLNNAIYQIGAVDASARTNSITLAYGSAAFCYGSHTLGSGVTVSGTSTQNFLGRGTMVFTSAGKAITFAVSVDAISGTFQLGDAVNIARTIFLNSGTFNANNYNLTCSAFSSSNTGTRTITMGSGLWTLSGTGTVWSLADITNLTFSSGSANILLSDTSTTARSFSGNSLSYNKLTIGGATGTSQLTLNGGSSFTELASTKTVAHTIGISGTTTVGTWSISGTAGNVVTFNGLPSGSRRTLTLTNSTEGLIDYLSVKDIEVTDPNRFYVGDNSTDGGNNLNVIFSSFAPPVTGNFLMFF